MKHIVLIMWLGYINVSLAFPDVRVEIDEICYKLDSTSYKASVLTSLRGDNTNKYSGKIVIPDSIWYEGKGYEVDSILGAFNHSAVTSVIMPKTITYIGGDAFADCANLELIEIPNRVKSIGRYAFIDCRKLKSIIIPNSVTWINSCAFMRCRSLTNVQLSDSLTSISQGLFSDCDSLKHIVLPENLLTINQQAFQHCYSFTSITIPSRVISIGGACFGGDSLLSVVYCLPDNPPSFTYGGVFKTTNYLGEVSKRDTLFVPESALTRYQNSPWADYFNTILPIHYGESEVTNIEETSAQILWEPSPNVELYQINVFKADTLIAQIQVDANEQIISQQYFAPPMRFSANTSIHNMPQDTTISGTDYYVISLSGLSAGTQYTYTITGYKSVPDETPGAAPGTMVQEKVYYGSGSFQTKILTAIPEIWMDIQSRKGRCVYLIDGRIVILRDGMMYDLMGRRL